MIAQAYHESGWPRLADNDVGFWSKIAFTPQPQRVRFPMLFQAADNEFLGMVGSHTALRQIGTPSDLYIFPNEDHIKSQQAHRLDRKSVVSGKSGSVRVDIGGRRFINKKKKKP